MSGEVEACGVKWGGAANPGFCDSWRELVFPGLQNAWELVFPPHASRLATKNVDSPVSTYPEWWGRRAAGIGVVWLFGVSSRTTTSSSVVILPSLFSDKAFERKRMRRVLPPTKLNPLMDASLACYSKGGPGTRSIHVSS